MATKAFFDKIKRWHTTVLSDRRLAIKVALFERWLELSGSLRSTLPAYQEAMNVREEDGGKTLVFALSAEPRMAQLVEFGVLPYDMRETLLKMSTRSIRVSKKGHLFLYVPFGNTTRFIRKQGGSVAERAARNLGAYKPGGGADRLPAGMSEKLAPWHSHDPLASLVRHAPTGNQRGSTYMTWRTISQNGRPWTNRGIQARNFMRQVLEYEADDIANKVLGRK